MRVLVFEHICGGGMVREPLLDSLQPMGLAMLQAVTRDLWRAGCHVTVTLDARVNWSGIDADLTLVQPEESIHAVLGTLGKQVDAVLIIAPEMAGLHSGYASALEREGVKLLGSSSGAIRTCTDKYTLGLKLARAAVPTPPTMLFRPNLSLDEPVIVKPRSGAGCEQTRVCRSPADLARATASSIPLIAQRYVPGLPVSAAMLVHPNTTQALRAGEQRIAIDDDGVLHYQGGRIPLPAELEARAMALALRAVAQVPGLRGFVGVDLVLGDSPEQDSVIEINPRITMAFTGLRHLCSSNLALPLLDPTATVQWNSGAVEFDATGRATVLTGDGR